MDTFNKELLAIKGWNIRLYPSFNISPNLYNNFYLFFYPQFKSIKMSCCYKCCPVQADEKKNIFKVLF